MLLIWASLFAVSFAQRPTNASVCDYYAQSLYGTNSSDTQLKLIQSIVSLAFNGRSNLTNVSSDITGILNPGTWTNPTTSQTYDVDLRPWFDGTIPSTNVNNRPTSVIWVPEGGTNPLYRFLSGQTPNVVLGNGTNEYILFSHFFIAFSRIFGCTLPPPPIDTTGNLNLAYVHKYMNLNQSDLGHFINQLGRATLHFGFSSADSSDIVTKFNARYNTRCLPAIGTQLFSLCQDPTCPAASPADCNAYIDLTPTGAASSAQSSTSGLSSSSTAISSSTTTSAAPSQTTSAAPAQTTVAAIASSGSSLSAGAIAGIAIGGAAVLVLILIAFLIARRRRRSKPDNTPFAQPPIYDESSYGGSPTMRQDHFSYASRVASPNMQTTPSNHYSYTSNGPTMSELESPQPVELGGSDHGGSQWLKTH